MRWHDDQFAAAMPPRVVQPERLSFRFNDASDLGSELSEAEAALASVCGWVFYNPLDRGLALCDRMGRLAGELVLVEERGRFLVRWEGAPGFDSIDAIRNAELKEFARSLVETRPTERPRLRALLELIDGALERIRPAAARRDAALFGRPLAAAAPTTLYTLDYGYQTGTGKQTRVDGSLDIIPAGHGDWKPVVKFWCDKETTTMLTPGAEVNIKWEIEEGIAATLRGPLPGGNSQLVLSRGATGPYKLEKGSLPFLAVGPATYVLDAEVKGPGGQATCRCSGHSPSISFRPRTTRTSPYARTA